MAPGGTISIYGLPVLLNESEERMWNLRHKRDASLSDYEFALLRDRGQSFDNTEEGSREVAEALIPHLSSVNLLNVWDRKEELWCLVGPMEDLLTFQGEFLEFVLDRPVLPLPPRSK
jgi:hypothetical protein